MTTNGLVLRVEALVLHNGDRDHGQQQQEHKPAWQREQQFAAGKQAPRQRVWAQLGRCMRA
jgi:hypothetical protein